MRRRETERQRCADKNFEQRRGKQMREVDRELSRWRLKNRKKAGEGRTAVDSKPTL